MRGNEHKLHVTKFQLDIRGKNAQGRRENFGTGSANRLWIPILVYTAKYLAGQGSEEPEII